MTNKKTPQKSNKSSLNSDLMYYTNMDKLIRDMKKGKLKNKWIWLDERGDTK